MNFSSTSAKSYSDPGHGWLKVPRSNLTTLNILHKISSYSYQRGDYVYLEEDSDCSKYFQAMQDAYLSGALQVASESDAMQEKLGNDFVEKYKRNVKHSSSNKSSKIRSYESFRMTMQELNCEYKSLAKATLRFLE